MPLIYQKIIKREDLQANPAVWYVFGDNLLRQGLGGQAREMRGEPNAMGIPTKKLPTMHENAFFTDADFDVAALAIAGVGNWLITQSRRGVLIVWPLDDIGTGRAQLKQRAPLIWNEIQLWKMEIING